MPASFCPQCGSQRTGQLRFCASCGFDFWQAAAGDTPAAAPRPAHPGSTPEETAQPQLPLGESLTRATIRAQAQGTLTPLAYWVGFALGAGGWVWLTYGWLAADNPLLWLGGGLVAGVLVGWALGTAVMIRLAPVALRQQQQAPGVAERDSDSTLTKVLTGAVVAGLVPWAIVALTR